MADQVVVLLGCGPALPKQALDPDADGVDYLLVEAEVAASEGALLEYLCRCEQQPELARFFVGKKHRERLAWMLLRRVPQAPPKVDDHIHVFRRTLGPAVPPADVVQELVQRFSKRLREARDVALERNAARDDDVLPLDGRGNLDFTGSDPGVFFPILGRHKTLCSLVRGAALAHRNFSQNNEHIFSEDAGVRSPHFNALIAYPGAGKTTIGTDFPSLLRKYWMSGEAKKCLEFSHGDHSDFIQMVEDSLDYNAFLYHNVDRHHRGRLYGVERELAVSGLYDQILALRLLFASISKPVSLESYEDMLNSIDHFAKQITLNNVLTFFREVMKPSHDRPILLSLFLDEINGAESFGRTTWVQEVMSSYVHSLQASRKTKVMLIMSVACTQHAAASLRLTSSRTTPHLPIPLQHLAAEHSVAVITGFFTRLAATLGRPEFVASDNLKLCIALCGGMPRCLGHMVRGMYTSAPEDRIRAAALLDSAQTFTTELLIRTVNNTIGLNRWDDDRYREGPGFAILLSALRHSILGTEFSRGMPVLQGIERTWGDLEQLGLISLEPAGVSCQEVEPEDWKCRVFFPPLLALAMEKARAGDYFGNSFPSAMELGDSRARELRDLKFVAFMIFLVQSHLHDPPRDFRLRDVIPVVWDMRRELEVLRLPYPHQGRMKQFQTRQRVTGALLKTLAERQGSFFSLLGCGNLGLDSVHVFDNFLIVTQTRSPDDARDPPVSDAATIFWSCLSDLMGVARLANLTTLDLEEFGPVPSIVGKEVMGLCEGVEYSASVVTDALRRTAVQTRTSTGAAKRVRYTSLGETDGGGEEEEVDVTAGGCYDLANIVYIYSSDHVILESERSKIMKSQNRLCRRIIIRQADSFGILDLLANVRYLSRLPEV